MMEFKWIEKYYQDKHLSNYLLRNINLNINEGEFVKIKKPSGNSRSDLLYLFGSLNIEAGNEYVFYDESNNKLGKNRFNELYNSKVGFIFKQHYLINELTVYENVEAPLIHQNINSTERKKRVAKILKKLNLHLERDFYPNQLSEYKQRKVSIARAVVSKPKIIVADEPLANLDSSQSEKMMEILTELNSNGTTILLATCSLESKNVQERVINLFENNDIDEISERSIN